MRPSAILCTVLVVFQLGTCACGCPRENLWLQTAHHPTEIALAACQNHDCHGHTVDQPLDESDHDHQCDHVSKQTYVAQRTSTEMDQARFGVVALPAAQGKVQLAGFDQISEDLLQQSLPSGVVPARAALGVFVL